MASALSIPVVLRMLLRDKVRDVSCRVVYVDQFRNQTWLLRVDDHSWPYPIQSTQLQEELDSPDGRFAVELDDPLMRIYAPRGDGAADDETATDVRHRKWYDLIAPLLEGENERKILVRQTRKLLIAARAKEMGTNRQTISSVLIRWWQRGMTYGALRPDYENCGGPGKLRNTTERKVGRPPKYGKPVGTNVNEETRRRLSVGASFLFRTHCTQTKALDRIVRLFYSEIRRDDLGRIFVVINDELKPTIHQFRYFLRKIYPYGEGYRRLYGIKQWNLEGRAHVGRADGDILGPGDRFLIDATIANVFLRSQFDRRRIVGRPVIYAVIDAFSRMIVGIYVGFEGPSWIGAMMALVNVAMPKAEYCSQYNIDIDPDLWPCHELPRRLEADHGELSSTRLAKNIETNLGIHIENPSVGRPDMQALIERRFGILPTKFKPFVPGYVRPDFGERGAKDYRTEATLNLFEFNQMVIRAVIEHNHHPITDMQIPAEMTTDGLVASPIDLWCWGIVNRSGILRAATVDEVALNVMIPSHARVTSRGIRFQREFYTCRKAIEEEWFARARHQEWDVDISYDPRDLGTFYLRDPKSPSRYDICRLIDGRSDRAGKTLFELEELRWEEQVNLAATETARQSLRIENDIAMEGIAKNAKAALAAVDDRHRPKAQKLADIRQNRSNEKASQRHQEKLSLETQAASGSEALLPKRIQKQPSNDAAVRATLDLLHEWRRTREGTDDAKPT